MPYTQGRRALRAHGRAISVAVALLMTATMGAACGGGSTHSPTKSGGQLVWAKPAEIDVLDPTIAGNGIAWDLLHLTYEGLVDIDDNKPVPALAESWRQTSPTTYVFNLRKGVKFSNGREMTVDDVVGTFKRVMSPALDTLWAGELGLKSVTASGPEQVTFTLLKPRTYFVAALAGSEASILPMRELDAKQFDPAKELLGTGPFKVVSHRQNESWTFARNPYYWRAGLPKADKVLVRIMPDEAARTAGLRDGSIDVTTFDSPDSVRLLRGQAAVKTVVQRTTDYYRLDVNAKSSIFSDDRLRQALSLAIDRTKIGNTALAGVGRPTAAASVSFPGACDPATVPYGTPNVRQARALVQAAGATGKEVGIITSSTVLMASPIAQVLQQNLQAAGLKVRIIPLELGEITKRVYSGKAADFDLNVSWFAGWADPAMALPWWNPAVARFNKAWMKPDPGLYALIDKSRSVPSGPDRATALRDTCARIAQDANMIPLISKDTVVAYRSNKISAVIPETEGYAVPLRHLAEFTVKQP